MPSRRPNVLFIVTDDHQASALGSMGNSTVQTPVLDRLAHRGVQFTQATHMGSLMPAICSPARACLLTGCHPLRANADPRPRGGSSDFVTIPEDLATLPERFAQAGYETFFTGKWHNDQASFLRSFTQAEDIFHGGMCDHDAVPVRDRSEFAAGTKPRIGPGFSTEIFGAATGRFLRQRDPQKPFLAWMALTSPHDPRTPPPAFRQRYEPAQIPLPPAFRPEPAFDNGELAVRDEKLAAKPLAPTEIREHLADYYGMITHQDEQIGRVLQILDETGATDDTIVVYIGDHGLSLGNHGLLGKQNLYEHSIRVPFILAGPGIPAGCRSDTPVQSLDVFATVLELAGLDRESPSDSHSLVDLFAPEAAGTRSEVYSLYKDCQRMVRDRGWKLIEYRVGGENRIELFDLAEDPHELRDRSVDASCADITRSLRRKLAAWQARIGDTAMPVDPDISPLSVCS